MRTLRVGFAGFAFIGKVHACGCPDLPLYSRPPVQARITHVGTARPATSVFP